MYMIISYDSVIAGHESAMTDYNTDISNNVSVITGDEYIISSDESASTGCESDKISSRLLHDFRTECQYVWLVSCQDLPISLFPFNCSGLATLKLFSTETRICRTKFGIADDDAQHRLTLLLLRKIGKL